MQPQNVQILGGENQDSAIEANETLDDDRLRLSE